MPATVKNKETYVDTLYYQPKETHIARFSIDAGSKIEKNYKDCRKETQSNQCKDEKVNATLSRDMELFLKNVAQYLVR